MGKVRLGICIGDEIYQERFVKCLMNRYKERYELHIFETLQEIEERALFDGYIMGTLITEGVVLSEEQMKRTLLLNEENMYQEVYKLIEQLERMLGDKSVKVQELNVRPHIIGIYSMTLPHVQMPLSATLADICSEHGKIILLDVQANSGLEHIRKDMEQVLDLEDVIAMTITESYSKNRLLSTIGHYHSWDYVYPVKNSDSLRELRVEDMDDIVKLLAKELGYQVILLNVGEGCMQFLEICDDIYWLYPKGETGAWRERSYVGEMQKKGKDDVLHRVQRLEISSVLSTDERWDHLAEQWKWSTMGDVLRKLVREVSIRG